MASKKKVVSVALVGLAAIIAAADKEPHFLYVPKAEADKLAAEGLVEINPGMVEGDKVATRPTDKGRASMTNASVVATAAPAAAEKPLFVIEDNVAIPAIAGRGRTGGSSYPFDKLAVNQSFFVPKEAKKLASTISAANARYAEVVEGETRKNRKGEEVPKTRLTRKFIVRSVEGGSRVWRAA